ncbi:MAG TPA: 6,7-dimethyl-8-ribityllumazine synthase [Gemmatimonadota bacterium]|nr:6,7-dimethyl-8-ribityllumazine synthase [Gemmatimonadota bacterium]
MGEAPELSVDGTGRRIALVVARFNEDVTSALAAGARAALVGSGVADSDILEYHVPGAFELTPACRQVIAQDDSLDAIVALGALIRGETAHFDVLADAVTRALMDLAVELNVPLAFGLLTAESRAQAEERADPARLDRGGEAARAALAQCALFRELAERRGPVRGFRLP